MSTVNANRLRPLRVLIIFRRITFNSKYSSIDLCVLLLLELLQNSIILKPEQYWLAFLHIPRWFPFLIDAIFPFMPFFSHNGNALITSSITDCNTYWPFALTITKRLLYFVFSLAQICFLQLSLQLLFLQVLTHCLYLARPQNIPQHLENKHKRLAFSSKRKLCKSMLSVQNVTKSNLPIVTARHPLCFQFHKNHKWNGW